jgi:hypothetical protein
VINARGVRIWATPVLLGVLLVLAAAYAHKRGVLTGVWLRSNKDAITALSALASASTVVVGGILAYVKFFRGRTLVRRAELSIDVKVLESPQGQILHFVTVSAKNIGTVTLVEPRISLHSEARRNDGTIVHFEVGFDGWSEVSDHGTAHGGRFAVVDTGEVAEFSFEKPFDSSVWAVHYVAILKVQALTWSKHTVVENVKAKE